MVEAESPCWRRRFWDGVKILLVYCAAGPLIGLIVFALGMSLVVFAGGLRDGIWLGPFILLYGLLFAHFVGLPWAALAGVASVALWRLAGNTAQWIGPASGAASFAVAALGGHVQLPAGPESPVGPVIDSFGVAYLGLMAVVHVLSAWGSWLAARGLLRT